MRTRRLVLACTAGALAIGILTGCHDGQREPVSSATAAGGVGTPTTAGANPSALPSASPSPTGRAPSAPPRVSLPPSPHPSDRSGQQTLVGQVQAGVEPGCLVLRDSTGTYQLMGGDPTVVYAGARVRVVGHVVTGVMSYCQQGRPFQVSQASPQP